MNRLSVVIRKETEHGPNFSLNLLEAKLARGRVFAFFSRGTVISCVYGWRVVFRRNIVGVSLLKKGLPDETKDLRTIFCCNQLF